MSKSPICIATIEKMDNLTGGLNWYDLYRNPVPTTTLLKDVKGDKRYGTTMIGGEERKYKRGYTMSEYTPWAHWIKGDNQPILGDFVSDYMNQAATREAFNIPNSTPTWAECSSELNYHLQNEASLWIYNVLINSGIKMMFYSGDTDGAIPTWGSKQWI